jgi:hypothetical protein
MRGELSPAIGFAAPAAAVIRTGRATPCWTSTADDVDAWLRTAEAGDTFVYAYGPQLVQGGAAARVTELTKAGDVTPHHKRRPDGGFDFLIRRNAAKKISCAPVCTPDMLAVLVVLQDAADAKRRCPSDDAIAAETGLSARRVKYQLDKLEAARFIARRTVKTGIQRDPYHRIVTVIATGASTAGPAS